MKLRNKLILSMLKSILSVLFILAILFNFIFDASFENYLKYVRNNRFETIMSEISSILKTNGINSLSNDLYYYAKFENIEIEIIDAVGNSVIKLNPLENRDNLIEKTYTIVEENREMGMMKISYYEDGYYNEMAGEFKNNFFLSLLLAGFISILVGLIASFIMSKNISKTIKGINLMALAYKNENYNQKNNIDTQIKELSELSSNMEFLGNALKSQEELRRKYAQNISHELRTPLTNLQLHVEAINDGMIKADKETMNTLKQEIIHLNKLVDQLKMSFNQSAEISKIKKENFNLSELLINTNNALNPTFASKGVVLKSEIEEDVFIISDKDKIVQIMYNLLSNALKASNRNDFVKVKLVKYDKYIRIHIIDEGIGIAKEYQDKIFDRFFKIDNAKDPELGGTGLGLSITKQMIESLNGSIKFNSELNIGT
ncbi:MAG: HAMP domain-containing sensor histidine kinase, partial [Tissierellia bacterium]|nr:HAMP domain-containing sensor histidine kinase [Tissierellia bacterium]